MKKQLVIAGNIALCLLATASLRAAEMTTLGARSGSKMRIEGTSNIHDWQVECPFIGGSLQVGKGFPLQPGDAATPGKVEATGDVFIPVKSLKSIEKNGAPYSDKMDTVMNDEHLLADKFPKITYHLTDLELKEVPKDKAGAYVFDSKGELAVAGVTNKISMPVSVTPLGAEKENRIKITGTVSLKMTDFKITPPAPAIAGGLIKTGDEVKLIFEWQVAPKKAAK
jgi:polyisoprenoid-binding protein YceI